MDPAYHGISSMQNQPPQIFTGPGGMPVNYTNAIISEDYNAYNYDDSAWDDRGGDADHGDAKRRRIARACDMCRKKKIKCDGNMPKCSHCENYKTECIFTQVEKKRQPPKGAKYIEGLENRLGRMESLLRMSGLLAEDDGGKTDLGTLEKKLADQVAKRSASVMSGAADESSPLQETRPRASLSGNGTPNVAAISSPQSGKAPSPGSSDTAKEKVEVDTLADQMCSLVTNNEGESRYFGSSSGFSIFSPKGIEWIRDKTGENNIQEMLANAAANDQHWYSWKPEVFGDIFARRTFQPLPPKEVTLSLLNDYFDNFNVMFPLFHRPTFMHLVEKHYSLEPYQGSGWWACLNISLAIAHRMRVMSNVVPQEEDQLAWMYLKNAMAVQAELTLRNNDLLSVQALLGMALFMQGTPNPQPSFAYLAAAIRLSHSIGLHKRGSDFKLNAVENEQRKRVFWIAYMIDKDMCLRSGRPPCQDDDDMNVDLPSEDPPDNVGNVPASTESGKFNLFRLMTEFSLIQSKVYKQLYCVKASRQTDGELLNTIGVLDHELEAWKDSVPIEYRPEHEINAQHTPLVLHIVCLHFAYYNCLTTIHRMSVHHGYWTSRLSDFAIAGLNARPLNPRVFMSAALCVNAARATVALIKYIPQGDHACVWLILYFPISALVTLFANILQNPQDIRARSDVRLMGSVVEFLSMLSADESHSHVRRMLNICVEFERISKLALEKADRESRGRGKKQKDDDAPNKSIVEQQIEAQASYRQPLMQQQQHRGSVADSLQNTPSPAAMSDSGRSQPGPHLQPKQKQQQHRAVSTPNKLMDHRSPPMQQGHTNGLDADHGIPPMDPLWRQSGNGFYPHSTPPGSYLQPGQQPDPSQRQDLYTDADINAMTNGNAFHQPFVPQDLWQMPMTLEWDWSDAGMVGPNMNIGMGSASVYDFEGIMGMEMNGQGEQQ